MPLADNLWLKGYFYIDRDDAGQLRIVGPHNHLYFGSVALTGEDIRPLEIDNVENELSIQLQLRLDDNFFPDPAMGHIRKIRNHIQVFGRTDLPFEEATRTYPGVLAPNVITPQPTSPNHITYLRKFGDNYYGVVLEWPGDVVLVRDDGRHGFLIEGPHASYKVKLTTRTSHFPARYEGPILTPPRHIDMTPLAKDERIFAKGLLKRTAAELDHLIRNRKTSGFDYGTVFPRDWMETADLIAGELAPDALRYMYEESLRHVNEFGRGWHEDSVGEFNHERTEDVAQLAREFDDLVGSQHPLAPKFRSSLTDLDELFVTRFMIDIEPHYMLGLRTIPLSSFSEPSVNALRRVAHFILERASTNRLITFSPLAKAFRRHSGPEYHDAGNWRDSTLAFKEVHSVIAPYDVNAVFYPEALRVIRDNHEALGIETEVLDPVITKWDGVKDLYHFMNPDSTPAYALALYDVRQEVGHLHYQMLKVNHTDEAYALFYGKPSEEEVISFTQRLLSPDYFYTASGPLLVSRGEGYDHSQYHGEVVWTKQTAYIVAGLNLQLTRAESLGWKADSQALIRRALVETSNASLEAFRVLGAVPELHYDDNGKAKFYTDQPHPEGQMNKVQLWSAAGARTILQIYLWRFSQ